MYFLRREGLGPHKKDTTTRKTRIDRLGRFTVRRSWAISFMHSEGLRKITNIDPLQEIWLYQLS